MQQILRNSPFTAEMRFYQGDTLTDLDSNPTLSVVDSVGDSVTTGSVTNPSTGTYRATLDGQSDLTVLTATWSGTYSSDSVTIVTEYEVVGNFLFPLADLSAESGLSSTSDERLQEARLSITDEFGEWCGVDFIPRPQKETLSGKGSPWLQLSHPKATKLIRVEIDGTSESVSNFHLYEHGRLERDNYSIFPHDQRNVVVYYEAGFDRPPADVARAGVKAAAYQINGDSTTISPRAMGFSNDFGNIRFAGYKPTGLPDVDAVLRKYRIPTLGYGTV